MRPKKESQFTSVFARAESSENDGAFFLQKHQSSHLDLMDLITMLNREDQKRPDSASLPLATEEVEGLGIIGLMAPCQLKDHECHLINLTTGEVGHFRKEDPVESAFSRARTLLATLPSHAIGIAVFANKNLIVYPDGELEEIS